MLAKGRVIAGKYRLERLVGTGGMGAVWVAEHVELDAPVAIKFQHAPIAGSDRAGERFRREAKLAARLRSPNIVRIHDYGEDSGVPFMAMELLEGESLRARLDREGRVTPREAARVLRQAAAGLDVAHAAGVVHRDIKPSNLFLAREGENETTKLLDFGIAKWSDADGDPTASSVVMGSARYMSPEQARGEAVDRRSDIWSLGVVGYEMLAGEPPFQGTNLPDTAVKICAGAFEAPSKRLGASFACFDPVFERALTLAPDRRPATATELADGFARAVAEWKETGAIGRASDTATMRATVTARTSSGGRRGGALGLGLVAVAAIGAAAAWQALRRESTSLPPPEATKSAAVGIPSEAPASALSVGPSPSAAPVAGASAAPAPSTSASPPPTAMPPRTAASARSRAVRPPSGSASSDAARAKAAQAPEPAPARSTDPDFGLTLPGR